MADVLEFPKKPALCACSSNAAVAELIKRAKQVSSNKDFVLLLDNNETIIPRLLPAFVNARIRVKDKIARAGSAQMEMLLLTAGTMNISKALGEIGVKRSGEFLLFATNRGLVKQFVINDTKLIREIKLDLDERGAGDVALTELKDS